MKVSKQDFEQACYSFRNVVSEGDCIYGIVRSVAKSGMSRTIDFYTFHKNQPVYLTGYMSKILEMPQSKEGALKVSGCGMDMVFACVYETAKSVFGNGSALKHSSL